MCPDGSHHRIFSSNIIAIAIDNKHNVIGQLGAMEEILNSGFLPKRTVYIAMGHDEEIGGEDGAQRIAQVLEKENLNFEFILDEGTMMVSGAIPGFKEPVALVGCAEKGFMNVEITVTGPGGHSVSTRIRLLWGRHYCEICLTNYHHG